MKPHGVATSSEVTVWSLSKKSLLSSAPKIERVLSHSAMPTGDCDFRVPGSFSQMALSHTSGSPGFLFKTWETWPAMHPSHLQLWRTPLQLCAFPYISRLLCGSRRHFWFTQNLADLKWSFSRF